MASKSDSLKSSASGTQPWSGKAANLKKTALTLSALLVLCLPIAACFETTRSTVTGTALLSSAQRKVETKKARCGRWQKIKYDGQADTFETIWQIRIHNQTGVNARCWRKDGK